MKQPQHMPPLKAQSTSTLVADMKRRRSGKHVDLGKLVVESCEYVELFVTMSGEDKRNLCVSIVKRVLRECNVNIDEELIENIVDVVVSVSNETAVAVLAAVKRTRSLFASMCGGRCGGGGNGGDEDDGKRARAGGGGGAFSDAAQQRGSARALKRLVMINTDPRRTDFPNRMARGDAGYSLAHLVKLACEYVDATEDATSSSTEAGAKKRNAVALTQSVINSAYLAPDFASKRLVEDLVDVVFAVRNGSLFKTTR
jgi:hypothetical protein